MLYMRMYGREKAGGETRRKWVFGIAVVRSARRRGGG